MGGGFYDREVEVASSATASASASAALSRSNMDPLTDPCGKILTCSNQSPIIIAVDVTGSMGDWPRVIYDKLPMFYGQLMQKGYLPDPAICFAAFGDATCSRAPLQVTTFAQGNELDDWLKRLWIEGGGGPEPESYAMCSHYFCQNTRFPSLAPGTKPFFFITADAPYRPSVPVDHIRKHIDPEYQGGDVGTKEVFQHLKDKFNCFCLFRGRKGDKNHKLWETALGGENVLLMADPKACIDVMLGVISVVAGTRDLGAYMVDLTERGQSSERQSQVEVALHDLAAIAKQKAAAGVTRTPSAEEKALMAELEQARSEIAALKLSKELEAAKAELAALKAAK